MCHDICQMPSKCPYKYYFRRAARPGAKHSFPSSRRLGTWCRCGALQQRAGVRRGRILTQQRSQRNAAAICWEMAGEGAALRRAARISAHLTGDGRRGAPEVGPRGDVSGETLRAASESAGRGRSRAASLARLCGAAAALPSSSERSSHVLLGHTPWREVSQARVDAFAASTDDFQYIHMADAAERGSPLGRPVAHGYLLLCLLTKVWPHVALCGDGERWIGWRRALGWPAWFLRASLCRVQDAEE